MSDIKEVPGADLDLHAQFDVFVHEWLGGGEPGALVPTGLLFQLFCLMVWQSGGIAAAPGPESPRARKLIAFYKNVLRSTERNNPHLLISRGLSFLNFYGAEPLETPAVDLGCETGLTASLLFDKPFAYGIDILPKWESDVRLYGMHDTYLVGSGESIPLPDASVRSIVMNNVLYHIANRSGVMREVFRCLEPGGRVLFDDLSPFFFEEGNRPFIRFLRDSGGYALAQQFLRRRNTMYASDRTINALEMLTAEQYPDFMRAHGFTNVSARYFFCRKLLRHAYNFLDMGLIFGSGAIEPRGPKYAEWATRNVVADVLRDEEICASEGGGYIFVTATKPRSTSST